LPRDAMQARPISSCGVCLSVRLSVCLSDCVSVTFVNSGETNKHTIKIFSPSGSNTILVFPAKRHSNIPTGPPPSLTWASNAARVGRNRDSEPISGLHCVPAVKAATGQVLSTQLPVDHCYRPAASCDTSLVVRDGVDCGRRQNVYDKKPQRYAKHNRTAHLTASSDKSVAYVTNNKILYSTFCTVEVNY